MKKTTGEKKKKEEQDVREKYGSEEGKDEERIEKITVNLTHN